MKTRPDRLERRLAKQRRLARMVGVFEVVWPALWPPLGLIGALLVTALLGLRLAAGPQWALLAGVAVGVVTLLGFGLRRVRWPGSADADRRIERDSGLAHRPLAALTDQPAGRAADDALWQAHVARARAALSRLRVGAPRPGMAARDRRALRNALLLGLFAALVIAGRDAPDRLRAALWPAWPAAAAAPAPQLQAWITPPAYTAIAPIFLHPQAASVSAPAGSHLSANVTGGTGEPKLTLDGHPQALRKLDAASWQADLTLATGGRLAMERDGRTLGAWTLAVVPDRPPTARWTRPPHGSGPRIRLPWSAADDFGVVGLRAELRLVARPDDPPVLVTIPVPNGSAKAAHGVSETDLTENPWAGLEVAARLVATDQPGQTGVSEPATFTLPERRFANPIARALIAARRMLTLHPEDHEGPFDEMNAILADPGNAAQLQADAAGSVNLGGIAGLLGDKDPRVVPGAQDRMWRLALRFEEGAAARTDRALAEARRAAEQALDRAAAQPNPANRAELDRRLQALDQAMREHLQALAKQRPSPGARAVDPKALERALADARQAARDGRMDDARERMAQLERMLDGLHQGRPPSRTAQRRQRAGRQQVGAVQDMIAREGRLEDNAQTRAPEQDGRYSFDPQPPPSPDDAAGRAQDDRVQQALRRGLGELMQQYGDLTGSIPESLGRADTGMRESTQALGRGDDAAAGEAEQRTIAALQQSGRDMAQQLAQTLGAGWQQAPGADGQPGDDEPDGMQLGQGDGGGDPSDGGPDGAGPRDPLGRRLGEGDAPDQGDTVRVPEGMERQRAQAIQEELRRRGADRARPVEELDYIDRLLRQF